MLFTETPLPAETNTCASYDLQVSEILNPCHRGKTYVPRSRKSCFAYLLLWKPCLNYQPFLSPKVVTLASKPGCSLSLVIFACQSASTLAEFFLTRAVFHLI